jgi:hypothetical protein
MSDAHGADGTEGDKPVDPFANPPTPKDPTPPTLAGCLDTQNTGEVGGVPSIGAIWRRGVKRLIEFRLEAGGSILAEVQVLGEEPLVPAGTDISAIAGKATQTFEEGDCTGMA